MSKYDDLLLDVSTDNFIDEKTRDELLNAILKAKAFDIIKKCGVLDQVIIATLNAGNPFGITDEEYKVLEEQLDE